ncbi:OLC1v1021790C1 [Oldenlandia corymbosa var. corymbosa]|uniref:OLC1v1021790C1 n=1 Tax=Oldenlandia corymbosa var. corymbosa TaxID=529605 RepID=A0AAV1BWG6_OLDCO|nr:OLC1v1021790C1 [Oldenlandia corymbosa var. corymbosa]
MATAGSVEQLKVAFEELKNGNVRQIVLHGEPGVGKTWMARKLSYHAIKEKLFDISLWLSLNKSYDSISLYKSVARQISLFPVSDEWEFEDDADELDENDAEDSDRENEELKVRTFEALKGKKVLLIFDGEGSQMKDQEILQEFKDQLSMDGNAPQMFIITCTRERDVPRSEETKIINVQCLSENESLNILKRIVGKNIDESPRIRELANYFLGKSKRLPREVLVIGKALSYFGRDESGLSMLENVKEENADHYSIPQLLSLGYEFLPRNILIDCFGIENQFLHKRGSVYYNELINYWILEGYLCNFDSIEDTYNDGHSVLMELIDCGLLKQSEPGQVSISDTNYQVSDSDYLNYVVATQLGLAAAFYGDLGTTAAAKGMIKSIGSIEGRRKVSTFMLGVDQLNNEIPADFLRFRKELEILAVFNPAFELLPLPLYEMHKLHLLVLRGCDNLETFESIIKVNNPTSIFQKLTVFEISGPSPLTEIPDELFLNMPHLKSLNLSSLRIESLPRSLYSLRELVWLILRQCSHLQELGSLKKCSKLEVLDLSGAYSLKTIHDKSFSSNRELRILNLSQSQIINLPLLRDLPNLTHLLLRDCDQLERLRKITALSCLQILDLSGCTNFKEFVDPSFEKISSLKVLDVSRTSVDKLPLDISILCELRATDCLKLKELPLFDPIKGLRVLNVSGSCHLDVIPNGFFSCLTFLEVLNLSNTNIKCLPALSDLHKLRLLLLSRCTALVSLGELQSTTRLEILDLSGSTALKEIQGESLEDMIRLQKLDLSGTKITRLPHLSSTNLRQLVLKNCFNLKEFPSLKNLSRLEELNLSGVRSIEVVLPDFEHMTSLRLLDLSETLVEKLNTLSNLKNLNYLSLRDCRSLSELPCLEVLLNLNVLDLSGTAVKEIPSLENFVHLRRLLLKDCLSLEKLRQLEIHEVLKDSINELPFGISKLTSLEQLELPIFGAVGHREDQLKWSISNWPEMSAVSNKLILTLDGVEIVQLLEENPKLRDKSFSHFHFFVHPVEAFGNFGDKRFLMNEIFLKDTFFRTRQLSNPKGRDRSLDIRGFKCFPRSLGLILVHSETVFLVDNPFVTCLSDLGVDNIRKLEACWMERCTEMEYIFPAEEIVDAPPLKDSGNTDVAEENARIITKTWDSLEILCVSHAPKLKSMFQGGLKSSRLQNLKCICLEHCPQISAFFSAPEQLGSLETLQLGYCDRLVAISEHEHAIFPKLRTLKLWALPQLRNITCFFPSLETLEIGECLILVNVFSSTQVPEGIKSLQIKFCDLLETVFESTNRRLTNLQRLCLCDLPQLKTIGADLPDLKEKEKIIRGCPKMT